MNARQAKRLLNVARSLRESPIPAAFNMACYIQGDGTVPLADPNWCHTPACALGHFAARRDLQAIMRIDTDTFHRPVIRYTSRVNSYILMLGDGILSSYFGIDNREAHDLFAAWGCGRAKTCEAAAQFIEDFVARRRTTVWGRHDELSRIHATHSIEKHNDIVGDRFATIYSCPACRQSTYVNNSGVHVNTTLRKVCKPIT